MANFLAIETSCDETAAAVFTDEPRILANVIASQTDLHAPVPATPHDGGGGLVAAGLESEDGEVGHPLRPVPGSCS